MLLSVASAAVAAEVIAANNAEPNVDYCRIQFQLFDVVIWYSWDQQCNRYVNTNAHDC